MRAKRTAAALVVALGLLAPALQPVSGAAVAQQAEPQQKDGKKDKRDRSTDQPKLPAPPKPHKTPKPPKKQQAEVSAATADLRAEQTATAAPGNGAPGANAQLATLVLYDSTGPWAWLGEAYGVQTANLVSHSSRYVLRPVNTYTAGQLNGFSSIVYIGSTYDEPIPAAFLQDVLATTKPVLWMSYNIWQLAQVAPDFVGRFGWTYGQFDFGALTTVTYKGTALQRDPLAAASGLLGVQVTDPAKVQVLATASGDGRASPWAVRSGNITYVAEIPFSYVGHTDRYFAAADLISAAVDPARPDRKRALVRIEDIGPDTDPADIRAIADYLHRRKVPFTMAVYPQYEDPNGVHNEGVRTSTTLAQAPDVVEALKYAQQRGGTILMHGYTHQFGTEPNPYDGTSGNDFEFYTAHVDANDYVIYDGPVPGDSVAWASDRINRATRAFADAGFSRPAIFEPPHYAASAADYQAIAQTFTTRYDRGLYFAGWCPAGACGTGVPDYTRLHGQYFPYLVRDVYGSVVVPESIGNVEPEAFNNHPARFPADLVATARALSVVRDGVASFFYHPYLGTGYLKELVPAVQQLGYQFVSAAAVAAG